MQEFAIVKHTCLPKHATWLVLHWNISFSLNKWIQTLSSITIPIRLPPNKIPVSRGGRNYNFVLVISFREAGVWKGGDRGTDDMSEIHHFETYSQLTFSKDGQVLKAQEVTGVFIHRELIIPCISHEIHLSPAKLCWNRHFLVHHLK